MYNDHSNFQAEKLASQFLKTEIHQITQNIERSVTLKFDEIQRTMEEKITEMINKIEKENTEKESVVVRNLTKFIAEQQDFINSVKPQIPENTHGKSLRETVRDVLATVKGIERKTQSMDHIEQSLHNLTTEVGQENIHRRQMVRLLSHVNRSLSDITEVQRDLRQDVVSVLTNVSFQADSSRVQNFSDELKEVINNMSVQLNSIGENDISKNIEIPDLNHILGNVSSLTKPFEMLQSELSMMNSKIASLLQVKNQSESTSKMMDTLTKLNARLESVDKIGDILSNLTASIEQDISGTEDLLTIVKNIIHLLTDVKNKQVTIGKELNDLKMNQSFKVDLGQVKSMIENLMENMTDTYNTSKSACNNTCKATDRGQNATDVKTGRF
jgi:hypothetical protein